MSYKVIPTEDFKKIFKRLWKKYPSLLKDLQEVNDFLEKDYKVGIPLGFNLYKYRISIQSKNKGKSGGGRIIYFYVSENQEIFLIHIYDKGEIESISKEDLKDLLSKAGLL